MAIDGEAALAIPQELREARGPREGLACRRKQSSGFRVQQSGIRIAMTSM
jgi:hypothetical protein